ncbi:MAG TPA: serine/threonine-protein kinase [Pyrinomonadaceae bacterium]|jgi:serine/threonine protein kinase|nr:serine/threonine-protein kinase [Pyrinomonadaceae bacterium]
MKCPSCQNLLADDAQFCGTCGLPTSRHPSDASTQIDVQQQTNADEPRSTDDRHALHKDPRIGLILDSKYKLIESLGQGGMGSVFRAQRLHIGDEVAVKLLHQDLVREQHALERFRREARTAAMIRHPNVVSIHDFNDGTGATSEAYIVMELVQGVSLGNLLRRQGRMSAERAVRLMQDICAGVGVAHRQGLLHRDLKPDNVIIVPPSHEGDEETAKVVDFGLAKVRDVTAQTALTQTGAVLGTLYYMAPEQCSGEELDARADVYSLGAMLYEMLTGGPPFRSNNLAGLISKHLHEPPPHSPPALGVPPAVESVCLRALAKNRNQRHPDAIAFGRDLQKALEAPVGFQPSGSVTTRRSPLRWIIAAAGVFIALIAIVGVGIAIQFGVNRMQAGRDIATNVNQAVNQNTPPVESPPIVSTSTEDLRGVWAGTYGPMGTASKLTIKNHNGNSLDGVLEQATIRVAFKGTYDSRSRTLTMMQTEVLSGEGWSLGEDVGKLSADGKKISGTGKDPLSESLGITYQWSFIRK